MKSKKQILIIDDEPDFAETMRFFLENAEFRVIHSLSPEEGIKKAHLKPDLILLDLNMPRLSGHEVCKRLKEDGNTMHIPIIMLTSQDRTIDKVEALNLGVADYVGKDFPFEEMLARIKAVLREASPLVKSGVKEEKNKKILELRKVIDEKNIRILFQPIVNLSNRNPIGFEALTRGPRGSFLESPLELFSLANEENMFSELDIICLNQAAQKADFINKAQFLFLNADPSVIGKDYFKSLNFIKNSAISPSQLCIEITERTCIINFAKLSDELSYFRKMGAKIVIDDVGEGYSSLKAIAELKPDFIKVDMGLVRNVNSDAIKGSLIQVIADLTKKINGKLIAEGIETEDEYRALVNLGIEYGQGYLFSKPAERF